MPTLLTQPVEDATRREFLAALAAAGLLVGCGSTEPPPAAGPGTRTVTDATGPVEVPAMPQRVVLLDDTQLVGGLVALGLAPAGTFELQTFTGGGRRAVRIDGREVPSVGTFERVNLERIAELQPDLIIGYAGSQDEVTSELRRLAPLVALTSRPHGEWKDSLRDLAEVVNRAEAADAAVLGFQDRARELRAALPGAILDEEVSLVELYPDGRIGYRLRNSFPGSVLAEVGLRRPPAQDRDAGPDECTCADFSAERLLEVDGDRFFVLSNPDTVDALAQVRANPLWQRLRAVQAGRVHVADLGRWLFGGIAQAHLILDDLRRVLVDGGEPASGEIDYTLPS